MNGKKKKERLVFIGKMAQDFRVNVLKVSQRQVASKLGITQGLVSSFELGNTDSAYILSYYLGRGLDLFL